MSLKRDENFVPVIGAVSSADSTTVLPAKIDPTTGRLLVSGIGANTEYTEGDTDTTLTGIVAMAEGASDTVTPLQVDASKNLKVNVVAGSASEQYADGTAVDASYKGNLILGTDGTNYQVIAVDSDGNPQVDVLTLPAITIAASQTLDTVNTITNVVHVDDNGGSLTVDVTGALPAGTNNIGKVDINSEPIPSTIYNNHKTVTTAGTAEALAASTAVKSVVIRALLSNTGVIYVGDSSVSSSNGIELQAGDAITIEIDDLAKVYLDASVSGEGVSYLAT